MLRNVLAPVAALAMVACGADPIVGEWEYENNNANYQEEWTIDPDGEGEFDQKITTTEGSITINGDIEWEESGRDNEYEVELTCKSITGGTCAQLGELGYATKIDYDCKINKDGDELKCEPARGGDKFVMEKQK